jgi:hypothetical protein
MKKTSRASRRRKSIGSSRRYKKGKTANKKRVKRASSCKRRRIIGGGDASGLTPPAVITSAPPAVTTLAPPAVTNDNPTFDAFKKLIMEKLGNNTVTIESTKLKQALPIIKSVLELLQTQQIDVTKMREIEQKIEIGTPLYPADLLELITFLYTNRNILKSGQIQLKPLFSSVVELLIENIPGPSLSPVKVGLKTSKLALLAVF